MFISKDFSKEKERIERNRITFDDAKILPSFSCSMYYDAHYEIKFAVKFIVIAI